MVEQRKISVIVDVMFTVVLLPLLITFVPVTRWIDRFPVFSCTLILYSYLTYFACRKTNFTNLFFHRKYLRIAICLLIMIGVTFIISKLPFFEQRNVTLTMEQEVRTHLRSQLVWYFFLIISGFSIAVELVFELFRQLIQKENLILEKNNAELMLYKSQINPHFLFNTLNSIYGLVISKSDNAETSIAKFSSIMLYMYTYTTKDAITISEEIGYIKNYVDLQILRLNSCTKVNISTDIENSYATIAPMILIVFVENSFKYGVSSSEDCEIKINITEHNNMLNLVVENDIKKVKTSVVPAVGIENCRRRLELAYPDKYTLEICDENKKYIVHLKIQLS